MALHSFACLLTNPTGLLQIFDLLAQLRCAAELRSVSEAEQPVGFAAKAELLLAKLCKAVRTKPVVFVRGCSASLCKQPTKVSVL